jgi:predicted phosphohydrolase
MATLHPLSDLHNEFKVFTPVVTDADIVLLIGDIDVKGRGVKWAAEAFPKSQVLYVPGNHEYYGGALVKSLTKLREAAALTSNVTVLDRDEVVINGIRFLGATGWTDYTATGNAREAKWVGQQRMNDFKKIRTATYSRLHPNDLVKECLQTFTWLKSKLAEPFAGKTVVMTHHAPSMRVLADNIHSGTHLDASYANAWDELMGPAVDLWFHGHTHLSVDMDINGTRNVSNQRGYPDDTGMAFNPALVVHLDV